MVRYVVGYDKQEQRSLVTSVRRQLLNLEQNSVSKINATGFDSRSLPRILIGLAIAVPFLVILLLGMRIRNLEEAGIRGLKVWQTAEDDHSSRVEFYERLVKLPKQGQARALSNAAGYNFHGWR